MTASLTPSSLAEASAGCVSFHLRRSARTITQFYDRVLSPSGLRSTQFTLLTLIRKAGGLPFSALAEALGMDRTTLTRNLHPLERDRLVKIEAGADRRVRIVRLTPEGERKQKDAEPLWARAHARMVSGIGGSTWKSLRKDLSRAIAVGLEATAEQEQP